MSMDMVDNLEYAEGLLGGAGLLDGYCRPTCSARDNADGECQEDGGREDCGCPCHSEPEHFCVDCPHEWTGQPS